LNEELYISIIGEVFDGYTEVAYKGDPVYVKHFNIRDQRYLQKYFEKYKNIALKKGILSQEQIEKDLEEEGSWGEKERLEISNLEQDLIGLNATMKAVFLPSEKRRTAEEIESKSRTLNELILNKNKIIGKTADSYASARSQEEMLRYFLFKDKELSTPFLNDQDFSEIDDVDLIFFINCQSEISDRLSELNIQKSVLRPFFSMYLSQFENIKDFYGKAVVDLSVYQLKTAIFSRMFFNIYQYVEDIPDGIRNDPEKLLSFSEMKNNKKNSVIRDDSHGGALFGASPEDIRELSANPGNISLSRALKEHGGSLNMEQMMELAGL
jgi:hypothetical protein